ncbi:hypothetical protein HPP92_026035 [Vanilla planifolia]|uniref:SPX domain-containing protein n=1 Tax=Vanilla planifolia TaxID=51239 RepID=A0A835PGX5_VANPL|nr:hypothetical protein HPP92_026308 [Vanilla planifolia]KAG0451777.1 hypothetical protein HPP92_026035 [Vanilla planifolia]
MKFGKRLKQQIEETLPQWRDKFLSYKDLKKLVRLISTCPPSGTAADAELIRLLDSEIHKLNSFFVEQEEDFVIRRKELQERIRKAMETHGADMANITKEIVNFHGEMVLLVNYSSINYTGLAKILKKYDKRTGALLRLPFIAKVLKQPFFTTELVSKLVKDCETMMDAIHSERETSPARVGRESAGAAEQSIIRNTVAALATMEELRKGSSTYGHFSLPPLDPKEHDDILRSLRPLASIII